MQINKNIAGFFSSNPQVQELFFTNDAPGEELGFYKENDANVHAGNLVSKKISTDGSVTKITRAEVDVWTASEVGSEQVQAAGAGGSEQAAGAGDIDHVVTQEDLDNNPDLAAQGIAVGDTIQIPAADANKAAAEIKSDVTEAVKKGKTKKGAKK